jgi:hypothetical protein
LERKLSIGMAPPETCGSDEETSKPEKAEWWCLRRVEAE